MPAIIEGPPSADAAPAPLWRRLLWWAGIAVGSAMITALAAYGLKALLPPHQTPLIPAQAGIQVKPTEIRG